MTPTRRDQQRRQTRQEILDTARNLIAEKGATALSLREIARRLGVTAPALYRYFPNRDALVTELIVIAYQSLQQHLEDIRQQHSLSSAEEQLLAIGRGYRQWGLAHPEDYTLIFGTPIPGYQTPPESTLPIARSSLGVLIAVIQKGVVDGEFKLANNTAELSDLAVADPEERRQLAPLMHTALALWSLVHGLTSLELFNHYQPIITSPDELFELELQTRVQSILINKD